MAIEDDDVDLLAEVSETIHHMRLGRLIALRQVCIQQADPDILAGVTLRAGMVECLPHGRQTLLNSSCSEVRS